MYHRIGAISRAGLPTRQVPVTSSITHGENGWDVVAGDQVVDSCSEPEVRISILWTALVINEEGDRPDLLTADEIVSIIAADLARRGIDAAVPESLTDSRWLDVVHRTYYPPIRLYSPRREGPNGGRRSRPSRVPPLTAGTSMLRNVGRYQFDSSPDHVLFESPTTMRLPGDDVDTIDAK